MMSITIEVPSCDGGNIGIHTVAREVLPNEVKPYLHRAIAALQAELDAVDDCPWHRDADALAALQRGEKLVGEDFPG